MGRGPGPALRERHPVVRQVVGVGADDAKAAEAVAQAQRNQLGHLRLPAQLLARRASGMLPGGTSMWNTPARINCIGLPLAPDHQVDAGQVALERAVDLLAGQQHEGDRGQAQRQQQQVEQRLQAGATRDSGRRARSSSCRGAPLARGRLADRGRPSRRARPPAPAGHAWRSPAWRCTGTRSPPAAAGRSARPRRPGWPSARRPGSPAGSSGWCAPARRAAPGRRKAATAGGAASSPTPSRSSARCIAAAVFRHAGGVERQRQVALDRQRFAQVQLLRQEAQVPGAPARRAPARDSCDSACPATTTSPALGVSRPGHQRQPGRLAGAGVAAQQQRRALRHVDIGERQ